MPGRLAGIDYGTVRIGIAVSDPERTIASPWETYRRRNDRLDADFFRRLVAEERIVRFVVGLPLHLDGRISEKAHEARRFGEWLHDITDLPIDYYDERYTSVEAERLLRQGGLSEKKRRNLRDQLAAQLLLAAYMEGGCRETTEALGLFDTES